MPFIGSYHQLEGQLHMRGRVRRRNETEHRVTNAWLINHLGEKGGIVARKKKNNLHLYSTREKR